MHLLTLNIESPEEFRTVVPRAHGIKNGQSIDLSIGFEIISLIRFEFDAMSCIEMKKLAIYDCHRLAAALSIFLLLILMTGTASAAYVATSNITYSSNTILSANVVNCIDLTIDTNVVLTTNGYDIYCAGNFINYGTIITGSDGTGGPAGQAGIGVPNSFAGAGGGGGASTVVAGENGGATLVPGGIGGTITSENGNPGNSLASPTISNANIITWSGNFIGYFSSAGGGGGLSGSGIIGGNGVYGLYIQASNIIAGNIVANGIAGGSGALLTSAGAGGGGGAFVLLSYGSGGYTAGTYNTLGGNGGTGATGYGNGGSGGNGNVVAYNYGTIPPLDIITLPSISQSASGYLDAGQSVTFSTSFTGGISPYTYNWIVSNTISGATVANSLYTSPLASNSFAWTIPSSAAGNTVFANVIITDSLSSNSQGSHVTVNSIESGTIKVNAAPSVVSLTPSATTLDSGQSVTYNSEITGGTGPFTANLVIGGTTVNTITGISAGAVFSFGSIVPPVGTDTYNVIATDDGTSIPFIFNSISNTIKVNAAPSVTSITPNAATLDLGQSVTYNSEITGGTGPFTANLVYSNSGVVANSVIDIPIGGTTDLKFIPTYNGVFTFRIIVTDIGTTAPYIFSALGNSVITVNNALSTALAPTAVPKVDAGQTAATDTLPATIGGSGTVAYYWYYSLNGGSTYTAATSSQCAAYSGTATSSLGISCVTPSNIAPGSYTFEVKMTDTASTPVTTTSGASGTATVYNALAGVSLTVSNSIIDVGQHETITYTWSGGTPTYTGNIVVSNSIGTLESKHFSSTSLTTNTLSFTVPSGTQGSYTVTANVFDSASTTVSNTLTNTLVANAIPTVIITPNTTTPVYGSSVKFTIEVLNGSGPTTVKLYNVTTSTPRLMGNVIVANSGATNTIIVSPAAISTFLFRANATDNAGYVFNSTLITITSHGSGSGGGGAGGGLPVATTTITTTTVSPATTTIVPVTTTVPGTAVSSPPTPPKNYTIVGTSYNITSSNKTRTITLPYNCSLPSGRIAPYIYINGTWSKITPFTVNTIACTITFTVPPDPIVAIMESQVTTVPTTTALTVATTVAPTTVVSPPVTPTPSNAALYAAIVIMIAIIIVVAIVTYYNRKNRHRQRVTHRHS